jgi:uncharacterized protein YjbI with pentapeptide repeats
MLSTNIHGLEIRFSEALKIIKDEVLRDMPITNQQLASSRVISSSYKGIAFSQSVFSGCQFEGVVFENCTFNNCCFEFTHFKNCKFINCDFKNCKWLSSTSSNSSYLDCILDASLSQLTETYGNKVNFSLELSQLELIAA